MGMRSLHKLMWEERSRGGQRGSAGTQSHAMGTGQAGAASPGEDSPGRVPQPGWPVWGLDESAGFWGTFRAELRRLTGPVWAAGAPQCLVPAHPRGRPSPRCALQTAELLPQGKAALGAHSAGADPPPPVPSCSQRRLNPNDPGPRRKPNVPAALGDMRGHASPR